jgi:hypothetical protein
MARVEQIGVAIGALGAMLILMALFPSVTGLAPTPGLGVIQLFVFLMGLSWFIFGALFYVKFAYYPHDKSTLMQQIGTRLAFTGLVLATMAALPDALGFGSHGVGAEQESYFGPLQAAGVLGGFFMACIGVLVYAVSGPLDNDQSNAEAAPDETLAEDAEDQREENTGDGAEEVD